jgi:prophage tail gpP-like protein
MNSIESISGEFTLTSSAQFGVPFPIKVQDSITIYIDNTPRLVGYVDSVDVDYDGESHNLTIMGRDRTADVIDSTFGQETSFSYPITLEQVTRQILSNIGIRNILVKSNLNIAAFTQNDGIIKAQVGQSLFSVIDEYCRKRQVLATTDGLGNILFTQSSNTPIKTILYNLVGNGGNIVSSRARYNWSERYNKYTCFSQKNGSSQVNYSIPGQTATPTDFNGAATDGAVRSTRQLNFLAEKSSDSNDCINRAKWQANWNRAHSFVYIVEVNGNSALSDGFVWRPNLVVKINDDFAAFNGELLISRVVYKYGLHGSTTEMMCVAKDSYTLQAEQDLRNSQDRLQEGNSNRYVLPAGA